jgi:hypothetical protein
VKLAPQAAISAPKSWIGDRQFFKYSESAARSRQKVE